MMVESYLGLLSLTYHVTQMHHGWKVEKVRLWAQAISLMGSSFCLLVVVYCNNVACSYIFLMLAQVTHTFSLCTSMHIVTYGLCVMLCVVVCVWRSDMWCELWLCGCVAQLLVQYE